MHTKGDPRRLGIFNLELARSQKLITYVHDVFQIPIGAFQHPYESQSTKRLINPSSLPRALLRDDLRRHMTGENHPALMPDEHIRVDPNHRRPPRLRMAQFISVTVTGFAGRLSIPASSDASTVAGSTKTRQPTRAGASFRGSGPISSFVPIAMVAQGYPAVRALAYPRYPVSISPSKRMYAKRFPPCCDVQIPIKRHKH